MTSSSLPMHDRPDSEVGGHWLLARLGKKVLRPGGLEMTTALIRAADLKGKDVVELAPGLGLTARRIVAEEPRSYTGVDEDPDAVARTQASLEGAGAATVLVNKAQATGLPDSSADVVFGEAMLTMHGEKGKAALMEEAFRILRPGGRYVIHELCLEPDTLAESQKLEIRRALAKSIRVNARPLTTAEWDAAAREAGFEVTEHRYADMALLRAKRNLQDEGVLGVARIAFNVMRMPDARRRVFEMRSVFTKYADNLQAIGVVLTKPAAAA